MGIVIAGFHRSGTSSLAQHLAHSGVDLGSDLIGATPTNPHGHFEDWEPVRFHDRALEGAGLDWASVTAETIPIPAEDASFIQNYSDQRSADGNAWGFKDPRVCQFLDRWMEAIPTLKVVAVYRSPAECAWSIYRRSARHVVRAMHDKHIHNRIVSSPDIPLALWVTHNRLLLDTAKRWPDRCVIVGHAAVCRGFNVAELVEQRFQIDLQAVDMQETFDETIVTRQVDPLPVSDQSLASEASAIWKELLSLDVSKPVVSDISNLFDAKVGWLGLRDQFLEMMLTECDKLAGDTNDEIQHLRMEIHHLRMDVQKLQNHKVKVMSLARKVKKWPFSICFNRSKRDRMLIDELLGE